ncbi:DUF1833 domain-containing protein [Citreicella sp. C3M06]|uniref:DUF1833 family protein n=1 Tax=Citreicella sp. C3M06 TaxID=2841564 RepID=UPI001C0932ED|nr:DUF1833 family protein [Citreicella sp. C3M06]MBU2960486.1 DUF1833 domain-containing protein [Citreicella sp. C3M06]
MTRNLSHAVRAAQDATTSDVVQIVLLRITHPDLSEPLRLTLTPHELVSEEPEIFGVYSDWEGTEQLYTAVQAGAEMPGDDEGDIPEARVSLQNTPELMDAIQSFTSPKPVVDCVVVSSADTNNVEGEWLGLRIVETPFDSSTVEIRANLAHIMEEPAVQHVMTPARAPGLRGAI